MKKVIYLFVAVTALFALSCEEKSNIEKSLNIESWDLTFEALAQGTQSVKVTAVNVDWDVKVASSASEWLTAVKKDEEHVEVSVKNNPDREQRIGKIEVIPSSSDVESKIITVAQKGNPDTQVYKLELDPKSLTFQPLRNEPQTITVTCGKENVIWTTSLQNESGWLSVKSESGKITVSVEDNDEERIRTERVIITPNDPSVEPASFVVEQMPVKVFSVEEKELYYEATGWALGGTISVKTVGVKWTMKVIDEDGMLVTWLKASPFGDMIEIHVSENPSPSPRIAHLVITPDTDEFEDIVVVITQGGRGQ